MPRQTLRTLLMIISLLPFAAVSANQDQANDQTRRFIRQTMQEQRIPGLQIAVVKDGQVVLSETYGLANVENGVVATRSTRFPLNSATKSFTGVALAQLAEDGRVDLDAPVWRYLDDLPASWHAVRVRQLLAHTSGLPDILDAEGLLGGGSEQDAWQAVRALPAEAVAGERFQYNQTNYSSTTRPTTCCWRGSSRGNPACPTNASWPPVSSPPRACRAPRSATATT